MIETLNSSTARPGTEYIRLHITPLNPTLLPSIVTPPVLSLARNISYHSLQTFPEKDFGFVDLPLMEAQKIKKKLNGSILKGTKVKIEDARPPKRATGAIDMTKSTSGRNIDSSERPVKRRKKDVDTIPAVELEERRVKRGWTDPAAPKRSDKRSKSKKDALKSKYTSGPECLFRTILPSNIAPLQDAAAAPDLKAARKIRKSKGKEVIVHEFSKTTKHATFLRSSRVSATARGVAEHVEGKGWVDQDGDVVEPAAAITKKTAPLQNEQHKTVDSSSDVSDSSEIEGTSDDDSLAAEDVVVGLQDRLQEAAQAADIAVQGSSTSSSGSSSDDDGNDDEASESAASNENSGPGSEETTSPMEEKSQINPAKRLLATPRGLKIEIPRSNNQSSPTDTLHPLEALFKRRRPDSNAPTIPDAVPSFTFFNPDGEEEEEHGSESNIPMTPYTQKDFTLRGQRSAAPTPDTAYPGKGFVWPKINGDDEGDAGTSPTRKLNRSMEAQPKDGESESVTDFQKWFYEHRGETNRAWKRRRKVAGKEKRHRENKKRSQREG